MELVTQVLAGAVLAVCIALLLRMVIGARLRYRIDAAAQAAWQRLRRGRAGTRPTPPVRGADAKEAARVAEEAIRRAARRGRWEGNVYKPDAFRPPADDKTDRRKPH
ncbi:MAG: hypothetical protein ACK4PH_29305 [Aquincola tertiaricarbonis]|uniref:hypothetical protein n=1 Tax=Aquincola TaxID=391952 RepID=UPI000614BDD2|nr:MULTISPECIES: hypothetical protein [Aquincola]MCR5865749.1 hypothetical protein [Aquincola sp. J276]